MIDAFSHTTGPVSHLGPPPTGRRSRMRRRSATRTRTRTRTHAPTFAILLRFTVTVAVAGCAWSGPPAHSPSFSTTRHRCRPPRQTDTPYPPTDRTRHAHPYPEKLAGWGRRGCRQTGSRRQGERRAHRGCTLDPTTTARADRPGPPLGEEDGRRPTNALDGDGVFRAHAVESSGVAFARGSRPGGAHGCRREDT